MARTSLRPFNTLGLDVWSNDFWSVSAVGDLDRWRSGESGKPFFVLGGGSNVVMTQDPLQSVLHMRDTGFSVRTQGDSVLVTAGAGHDWHRFVERCLGVGAYGLENLALIPGTVGASPIQNIGAYGVEMRDRFHSLTVWNADSGECSRMTAEECSFAYRDSVFKRDEGRRLIVLDVTFRLSSRPSVQVEYGELRSTLALMGVVDPTPLDVFSAVCRIRREKLPDPAVLPNVGSFFKNPILDARDAERFSRQCSSAPIYPLEDERIKVAAGWLIDQCGWKGRRIGNVAVHDRQALVIVNVGGDGAEVLAFAELIRADVQRQFSIFLEIEPTVV
jgi:UDP-N-acetylmuramate dehydrogenase